MHRHYPIIRKTRIAHADYFSLPITPGLRPSLWANATELVVKENRRREFPDVAFHDFELWAKAQDWNTLLQRA